MSLEQRHPLAVAALASLSTIGNWLLAHHADITGVFGMIAAICSAIVAVGGACSYLHGRCIVVRRWWHARQQRRAFETDDLP